MKKTWFTERVGKTIIRTNTYDNSETEWEVTEQNAGYLWLFTEKGYTYRDAATITENVAADDDWLEAAKPRVVIHKAPNLCLACEG